MITKRSGVLCSDIVTTKPKRVCPIIYRLYALQAVMPPKTDTSGKKKTLFSASVSTHLDCINLLRKHTRKSRHLLSKQIITSFIVAANTDECHGIYRRRSMNVDCISLNRKHRRSWNWTRPLWVPALVGAFAL